MKRNNWKLLVPILAVMLLLGCAPSGSQSPATPDTPQKETGATGWDDFEKELEFTAQYIRTNGPSEGLAYPDVHRIGSRQELEQYYAQNKDTFDLERNSHASSDFTVGFLDACDGYDGAFFEDRCLVMVLLEEGSGSIRHQVRQVKRKDGSLSISIDTLEPEIGTCDMAQWHILLELPREDVPENKNQIMVFLDGQLRWHRNPIRPSGGIDTSRLSAPPKGTLIHSNGSAELLSGGFEWNSRGEDGTVTCTIADALHPLDCVDRMTPVQVEGDYAKTDFEAAPDYITVRCWPDSAVGLDSTPEATAVTSYDLAFDLLPGSHVYEITAVWSDAHADYGTATYIAYLDSQ